MENDGVVWLASLLFLAVPIGLAMSRYWAKARASGAVRLDGSKADPAAGDEPEPEPGDTLRP